MKIAMMVRGYVPVPRPSDIVYAPIDLAVNIAEGLVKKGHEIDFFAPMDSKLENVNVVDLGVKSLGSNQKEFLETVEKRDFANHQITAMRDHFFANEMFRRASEGQYDILHFHHPETGLLLSKNNPDIPVAFTRHDTAFKWLSDTYKLYLSDNQYYISVSDDQRLNTPGLPYFKTIYNGIDTDIFDFNEDAEDYLVIVGRLTPEKGIKEAIEVAQKANMRLLIVGPMCPNEVINQKYFHEQVKPHLNDKIQHVGFVENNKVPEYLKKAKAFLMPIQWQESFGVVMAEAMACGTPVIGFRKGSVPEVVKDGVSGFVVDDVDEMVEAVKKIDTIDRAACRKHVEDNFSIKVMVDNYEKVFEEIIDRQKKSKNKLVMMRSKR